MLKGGTRAGTQLAVRQRGEPEGGSGAVPPLQLHKEIFMLHAWWPGSCKCLQGCIETHALHFAQACADHKARAIESVRAVDGNVFILVLAQEGFHCLADLGYKIWRRNNFGH